MDKILIIEDEAHLREEVASTLKYENFEVLEAENGNQGLKMAIEKKPNLILCDILMPGMDGYEVFNEIKKTLPAQIPFIFITALDKRTKRRQGMEMGADDFLIKPFTREELLNSVKARLKKTAEHQNQIRHIRECIVYSIPHEMRTPLSAILGLSEILTDEAAYLSKEEINEFGNSIFKSGKRLHEIIQKLKFRI